MIGKGKVVGYADIISKKGDKFKKVCVEIPPVNGWNGKCYTDIIVPDKDGFNPLGADVIISVDRFGRLNDIQF